MVPSLYGSKWGGELPSVSRGRVYVGSGSIFKAEKPEGGVFCFGLEERPLLALATTASTGPVITRYGANDEIEGAVRDTLQSSEAHDRKRFTTQSSP